MPKKARRRTPVIQTHFAQSDGKKSNLGRITQSALVREVSHTPSLPMRLLNAYAIVYLIHGSGFYEDTNGIKRTVTAGDMILVFPDIPHRYGPSDQSQWSEFYLVFEGPMFDLWRQHGLLDPQKPIHSLKPINYWLRQFESVLATPRQIGTASPVLEAARLQQVLAEALLGSRPGQQSDQRWASKAIALMESRLANELDLREIADELNMGYETFRQRFRRVTGQSPGRHHAARLIDRSCQLMQTTDMSSKEIAAALGFCDEFYFSRRFKQITGQSPRQFRQSLPNAS